MRAQQLATMPPNSPIELAVMFERMEHVLANYKTVSETLLAISAKIDQFPVLKRDIEELDAKTDRIFEALKAINEVTAKHSNVVSSHSLIWKLTGAIMMICTGLIGFSYNTLQQLKEHDYTTDRRLMMIEFKLEMPIKGKVHDSEPAD